MTFEDTNPKNNNFLGLSNIWIQQASLYNYAYNFTWLGIPIMQIPQDIYAYQELIWKVKPDLIIETGIAHGGSLILCASMLALLDYCESEIYGTFSTHHKNSKKKVIGIDTCIREHNRKAIEKHPLTRLIKLIEGSSVEPDIIKQVIDITSSYKKIMVFLDSNHTHNHVLSELKAYAHLVSIGSYCVVWDTGIEELPEYINSYRDRPWGKGNNPKTAVHEYLKTTDEFEIDKTLEHKLMITASSDGFLKRIK